MKISFEEYRARQVLLEDCFDVVTPDAPEELKENWLAVVFQDTLKIEVDALRTACEKAKSECEFHGEILPFLWRVIE